MTEDKELQDILRKIDELRDIIEAHMVEINKDLENLFTHDLRLEDKVYEIDARVEDLEKSPNEARILATNTYESEGRN